MKILVNFDKAIAEVLADKVKARLTFKVGCGAYGVSLDGTHMSMTDAVFVGTS